MELKSFAIHECENIPSNDKILMDSFVITHRITRRNTDSLFEEHTITIEWMQIRESEEINDLSTL